MALRDGNGWVDCRCGARHWGLHGAAGLLLLRPAPTLQVLLQLRAGWTHEGGTWGIPGGARDSHEDVVAAALREAHEETGLPADGVRVVEVRTGVDHQDWSYTYVIAVEDVATEVHTLNDETDELRWVDVAEVSALTLHRGFAAGWGALAAALPALAGR